MKLLIAVGQQQIHTVLKKLPNIEVCAEVFDRQSLVPQTLTHLPDVVIVAERLGGKEFAPVYQLIEDIRIQAPKVRVVYLAGDLNIENQEHKTRVQRLAALGVYDIHTMKQISTGILTRYLYSAAPRSELEDWFDDPIPSKVKPKIPVYVEADMAYPGANGYGPTSPTETQPPTMSDEEDSEPRPKITIEIHEPVVNVPVFQAEVVETPKEVETFEGVSETLAQSQREQESAYETYQPVIESLESVDRAQLGSDDFKDDGEDDSQYIVRNVYVVSSIKPGTGKSFISTNLAAAIAKFGRDTPDGRRPTVAIIEGDLQNLSIGTLLSIQEDEYNLKTAMEQIDLLLDPNGGLRRGVTEKDIDIVNRYVNGCFKPYYSLPNLKTLVGSQFQPDELSLVTGSHYSYLIESIADHFDVVIVDTNSNLNHISTVPLLRLANQCYYVINLDFNNVHNNHRYRKKLVKLGIGHKIKYVLNEDISLNKDNKEELRFGPADLLEIGYRVEGSIPAIDKSVFLNRVHEGVPIVLDNSKETLRARLGVCQIADSIWEMDNLVALTDEYEKYEASTQKKKRKKFLGLF